jgi:hypothetical protein
MADKPKVPQDTKIVSDVGFLVAVWLHFFNDIEAKLAELEARIKALGG